MSAHDRPGLWKWETREEANKRIAVPPEAQFVPGVGFDWETEDVMEGL